MQGAREGSGLTAEACPDGGTDEWTPLDALGVRVREVTHLAEGGMWLAAQRLLLVDRDLSVEDREHYECHALGRALEELLPSPQSVRPASLRQASREQSSAD